MLRVVPGPGLGILTRLLCIRLYATDLIENGTLRDQLIYPHSEDDMSMTDAQLVELMRSVDLDFVLARAEGARLLRMLLRGTIGTHCRPVPTPAALEPG